ncbi:hypothetical protein OBBRIDRAFT_348625 [Obba rivulosa]|uniref:Uncharacterized protein n=1 Tax=Obba rivulosa TaxID=1052685 RepID=A0A8E2AMH8_9APHY|nr:hypothetical protein OBBRIDRAFT_348625 [Obba rivulosa]
MGVYTNTACWPCCWCLRWIPTPDKDFVVSRYSGSTATLKAWNVAFVGDINQFIKYIMLFLDTSERNALTNIHNTRIYAHYVAWYNSSGTGKSRASHELSKIRFLIPVCLRDPRESGFPPSDHVVREYILSHADDPHATFHAYLAFLTACYKDAWHMIDAGAAGMSRYQTYGQNCMRFHEWMGEGQQVQRTGENRAAFYARVIEKAKQYQAYTETPELGSVDEETTKSIDNSIHKLKPDGINDREQWRLEQAMVAFGRLCNILTTEGHPTDTDEPLVYLSFDEAHVLTSSTKRDHISHRGPRWSMFSQLRRALRVLNDQRLFSLFLSTSVSICQLSPDPWDRVSQRLQDGQFSIIPPYTDFGFDHMAMVCERGDEPSMDDIAKVSRLVKLGRPLFSAHYEEGEYDVKSQMLNFAAEKLICGSWPDVDELDESQKLACLSTRLGLQFTPTVDARKEAASQVERHLRVCIASDDSRHGLATIAGSEPIVAEAAKRIMKGLDHNFDPAATLAQRLQGPTIDTEDRGELIVELLLLRAYDEAAYKLSKHQAANKEPKHSGASGSIPTRPFPAEKEAVASHPESSQHLSNSSHAPDITPRGHETVVPVTPQSNAPVALEADAEDAADKLSMKGLEHDEALPIVPLVDFLQALFPEGKWANAKPTIILGSDDEENARCMSQSDVPLAEAFKDTYVFFNHFIQLRSQEMLNRIYLHSLILRCAAGICTRGQDAIDAIVPLLFGRILKPEKIGGLAVQTKLNLQYKRLEVRLFDVIDPFSLGIFAPNCDHKDVPPIIRIVFSLGSEDAYMWPGPFDANDSEYERRSGPKRKMHVDPYADSDDEPAEDSDNASLRKKQKLDDSMPAPQPGMSKEPCTSSSISEGPSAIRARGETASREDHRFGDAPASRQTQSRTRAHQDAARETPPAASERARKERKRTGNTAAPLAGPSNWAESDLGIAEEQTGRNDTGPDAARPTRSKARQQNTATTTLPPPREARGSGAATSASRTRTRSGNSQPGAIHAKPPGDSNKKTRSRKGPSGRAFLLTTSGVQASTTRSLGQRHQSNPGKNFCKHRSYHGTRSTRRRRSMVQNWIVDPRTLPRCPIRTIRCGSTSLQHLAG